MANCDNIWRKEHQNALDNVIKCQSVSGICRIFFKHSTVIMCKECQVKNLCSYCDSKIHEEQPFHNRFYFGNGYKQPLGPMDAIDKQGQLENKGII